MLSREDFMFTIGYDGPIAVVDGQAKKKYGKFSTAELANTGLFRAAYCSALRSGSPADLDAVITSYNAASGSTLTRESPLGRLFGVYPIDAIRSKIL
jgi:hypothetical protein